MAQKKKKVCPKCNYKRHAKKFRSGCSVCDHCERLLREEANSTFNLWRGVIPRLTPAEKKIYSKP